jgi:hypothetical protein
MISSPLMDRTHQHWDPSASESQPGQPLRAVGSAG